MLIVPGVIVPDVSDVAVILDTDEGEGEGGGWSSFSTRSTLKYSSLPESSSLGGPAASAADRRSSTMFGVVSTWPSLRQGLSRLPFCCEPNPLWTRYFQIYKQRSAQLGRT